MDEVQGKRYATARLITENVIEFISDRTGNVVASNAIGSDAYDDIEDVFNFLEQV